MIYSTVKQDIDISDISSFFITFDHLILAEAYGDMSLDGEQNLAFSVEIEQKKSIFREYLFR